MQILKNVSEKKLSGTMLISLLSAGSNSQRSLLKNILWKITNALLKLIAADAAIIKNNTQNVLNTTTKALAYFSYFILLNKPTHNNIIKHIKQKNTDCHLEN